MVPRIANWRRLASAAVPHWRDLRSRRCSATLCPWDSVEGVSRGGMEKDSDSSKILYEKWNNISRIMYIKISFKLHQQISLFMSAFQRPLKHNSEITLRDQSRHSFSSRLSAYIASRKEQQIHTANLKFPAWKRSRWLSREYLAAPVSVWDSSLLADSDDVKNSAVPIRRLNSMRILSCGGRSMRN